MIVGHILIAMRTHVYNEIFIFHFPRIIERAKLNEINEQLRNNSTGIP